MVAEYRRRRVQPCMRCGQEIDYDAPPESSDAFNLGHILSWRNHPELRLDPGNVQAEHAGCGKSAGADDGRATPGLGLRSREW